MERRRAAPLPPTSNTFDSRCTPAMAGLFISYRRDDSQGFAAHQAQAQGLALGEQRVFSDVEIAPGHDFSEVPNRAIAASDALLVVIGRHSAAASSQGYASRLFEPTDWVRTEIEAAPAQGKLLIPHVGGRCRHAASRQPAALVGPTLTEAAASRALDRHTVALPSRRLHPAPCPCPPPLPQACRPRVRPSARHPSPNWRA